MSLRPLIVALSTLVVTIASVTTASVTTASAQTGGAVSAGTVTSIDSGKITVALSDGGTFIFSASDLAPGAKIVLGGQTKPLTDIRVGMKLNVVIGPDLAIHSISDAPISMPADASARGRPKPATNPPAAAAKATAPTQWNTASVDGKFRWWTGVVSERGTQGDGAAMTMMFVLTRPGSTETQTFHPDSKTKFYVTSDGKPVPASFATIVLNATVSVAVQDGHVVQATVLR